MIEALETAVLNKDPQKIVEILSTASEEERAEAQRPLKTLWLAKGIDTYILRSVHTDLNEEHPDVLKKRAQYKLTPMDKRSRNYDYQLGYIAWLAWFGVADQAHCSIYSSVPDYEAESAQIMADRQPPWLEQWIEEVTSPSGRDKGRTVSASYWVLLHQHGLLSRVDRKFLVMDWSDNSLPHAFEKQPEATQKLLREVPDVIDHLYEVPSSRWALSVPKTWEPLIHWLNEEGLLDRPRMTTACLEALNEPLNKTERNSCIIFAKSAIGKPNPKSRKDSLLFQSQWIGLLSDAQAVVAGFALDQLLQIEKEKKLNGAEVVVELPSIFQHKPKGHARKAVALLDRLAKQADLRVEAVRGLTFALAHPAKEVQEDAIAALAVHLENSDEDALDAIRLHLETVVPTLRARLETLLPSTEAVGTSTLEAPSTEAPGAQAERIAAVDETSAQRFALSQAVAALDSHQLAEPGQWRMNEIRVLDHYEAVRPIETVDELVQVTSAAVEALECPDTLDRIVDGIIRLHKEKPKHFPALTKSLRNRACQPIMSRPLRGMLGGYSGESMTRLIVAWLKEKGVLSELMEPNGFPPAEFLWEVSERLRQNTIYPLLSTPTHRGGWIDPVAWVRRLETVEASAANIMDSDMVRSLLRLAPDRRDEAWQLVDDDASPLSPRMKQLANVAIKPTDTFDDLKLDDRWSIQVWIAAIRARDPWIDLKNHLPAEEIAQVPIELWRLPDVLKPANYQWKAVEATKGGARYLRPIKWSAMAEEDRNPLEDEINQLKESLSGEAISPENIQTIMEISNAESQLGRHFGFLTAKLNDLKVAHAPMYVYAYLATIWPMKLDWYWNRSTLCLVDRIESGSSVEERYAQFLLPLFEPDRCVTTMAARALWIATASKDTNAKAMAIEAWVELMNSDRCHIQLLVDAWDDVYAGGWMKLSRVVDVLTEATSAGPLPAWISAKMIATFLARQTNLPRESAKLLELLDECHQRLGLAIDDSLREKLLTVKSGKAKSFAKSLLGREDLPTPQRTEALSQAFEARLARAERCGER